MQQVEIVSYIINLSLKSALTCAVKDVNKSLNLVLLMSRLLVRNGTAHGPDTRKQKYLSVG